MNTLAEAAMLIAAMMSVGQQFICIDQFQIRSDEYSGEYFTASMLGAGTGGLSTYIASKSLWIGEQRVNFTGVIEHTGITKKPMDSEVKTWHIKPLTDADDWAAKEFAESQPGYVPREIETREERLARVNQAWADGDDDFPGYAGHEKYEKYEKYPRAGADLILMALALVQILNLMTGMGPPCDGGILTTGSNQFIAVSEKLGSAFPENSWQGRSARAYADQNDLLQGYHQVIADLDHQLATCVKDQANWVNRIRLGFELLAGLALAAYHYEGRIRVDIPPPVGLHIAWNFARIVSAVGIMVAVGLITTLAAFSDRNGANAKKLIGQYLTVSSASSSIAGDPPHSGTGVQ